MSDHQGGIGFESHCRFIDTAIQLASSMEYNKDKFTIGIDGLMVKTISLEVYRVVSNGNTSSFVVVENREGQVPSAATYTVIKRTDITL
jgi:hypothetical protein